MATLQFIGSKSQATLLIAMLRSWIHVIPPQRGEWSLKYGFWLGTSADFNLWVLFAMSYLETGAEPSAQHAVAWLEGVDRKNVAAIAGVLCEAYRASLDAGMIPIGAVEIASFPPVRSVEDVGQVFPSHWSRLPASLEVSLALCEGQGVNQSLYDQYSCSEFAKAFRILTQPRVAGLLINYALRADAADGHRSKEGETRAEAGQVE